MWDIFKMVAAVVMLIHGGLLAGEGSFWGILPASVGAFLVGRHWRPRHD